MQPQFANRLLTSVSMTVRRHHTTLAERLALAMGEDITAADLARECGISRAAMSKLLNGKSGDIKANNALAVARRCRVNVGWLVTGEGPMRPGVADSATAGIPPHRIALIQAYGRLPADMRAPIRLLIETLALAQDEKYAKWSKEVAEYTNNAKTSKNPA